MWETEHSIEIAAPIENVYTYLADFERHREWSLGVADMQQTTNGPVSVGTEFRANEVIPVKFVSYSRITALEPPNRIAWQSWDDGTLKVNWTFILRPTDTGTRLVQQSRIEPVSLFGKVMLRLLRQRQMPKENQQSLNRIKTILEQSSEMPRPETAGITDDGVAVHS